MTAGIDVRGFIGVSVVGFVSPVGETVHLPSFSCMLHPITTEITISYDCVDKQFKFELYIQLTSLLLNRQLLFVSVFAEEKVSREHFFRRPKVGR